MLGPLARRKATPLPVINGHKIVSNEEKGSAGTPSTENEKKNAAANASSSSMSSSKPPKQLRMMAEQKALTEVFLGGIWQFRGMQWQDLDLYIYLSFRNFKITHNLFVKMAVAASVSASSGEPSTNPWPFSLTESAKLDELRTLGRQNGLRLERNRCLFVFWILLQIIVFPTTLYLFSVQRHSTDHLPSVSQRGPWRLPDDNHGFG